MTQIYLLLLGPQLLNLTFALAVAIVLCASHAWAQAASSGTAEVIAPIALRLNGRTWTLFGIRGLPVDAQCTRRGAAFDCGHQVMNLLRDKIDAQRVSCEARSPVEAPEVSGVCSIAGEDIAAWLVRGGWAFADPGVSVNYLVDESYARMQSAGLWEPEVKLIP